MSLIQQDSFQVASSVASATNKFFDPTQDLQTVTNGTSLVVVVLLPGSTAQVSSITDDKGNTYQQVPNAFAATYFEGSPNAYFMDVWWAQNVIGGSPSLTINLSQAGSGWGAVVLEVNGIVGASTVASASTAFDNPGNDTFVGPSLNGGSGAFYITALNSSYAALSKNFGSTGHGQTTVNSPWTIPVQVGGLNNHGKAIVPPSNFAADGMVVACLSTNGTQQAVITTVDTDDSDSGLLSGVAFIGGSGVVIGGGGGYWSDPFLSMARPRVDNRPAVLKPGYKPNYKLPPRRPRR